MKSLTVDYYDHPVFHPKQLQLETTAMQQLTDTVSQWLWTGCTGGLIYGNARIGKTTAAERLSSEIFTRGKKLIPYYYTSVPRRDQKTIAAVHRQLCRRVNLRVKTRANADDLSASFVHYVADKSVEYNCQQALLIVDEMQRLHSRQFDAFAEIYDDLLELGIIITVVFVGNDPECWKLIEMIKGEDYAHIRGRFFRQGSSFLGLTSEKQVKQCLSQYDSLRFPEKGPTFTEYFLPYAVKKGWQLSTLSELIWNVFREYQKTYHIKSWGMQYFTVTVNTLLTDFLPQYGVDTIDDKIIHECIRISGLLPSLVRPVK